jgi:hypothetical protein
MNGGKSEHDDATCKFESDFVPSLTVNVYQGNHRLRDSALSTGIGK